ncbi:MASE4 domain-containing protein [Paenibacillus koleovorans]|uniref:MASE4 domain-containing protein n=1 Tax=Paenibacillus koleovorans TaxID=121608 RepID=UPI0013E38F81|nr:MASE4 domain-containing protein [Paenibacillus koleovorans]
MSVPQPTAINVHHLLNMQTHRSQRRLAFMIGAIVCFISLLSIPFARVQLPEMQAYQPIIFSTVICFELLTAYVLLSQFRVTRSPAVLVLFAGYLFSAGMTSMYLMTFPRIFTDTGLFHAGTQTAPWLYLPWHLGFALAILLYTYIDKKYKHVQLTKRQAKLLERSTLLFVAALIAGLTFAATSLHDSLPVLLHQGKLTPLFLYGLGWPIVGISLAALIWFFIRTRGSTVTHSWLCVALLASLLDVTIVLCGGGRFSIGWYVAKWNSFVCANIVLGGMIYEFTKMYVGMTVLYRQVTESESRYKELWTESQLAERKIAEQNDIIGQMLQTSQEAIVMCDQSGSVVFANQRFGKFFGRPLTEGDRIIEYCMGMKGAAGPLSALIELYLTQNKPTFRERITYVTSSRETRHYECYASPITDETSGELRGHLLSFRDRTDEERIDEMKNEFVSIISHEIRTPLTSILGFVEILSARDVGEDRRTRYIATIYKEATRLSNLINDFLDLQRMASGRQEFHFKSLDAVLLLREIVEQWQGKDNHETLLHAEAAPIWVKGDEDKLKQVFHNLLSNAIKYSPGATRVDIYVETDNGTVLIKVQDYGLGIPPEALDKLFTRFYRVDNSDRRQIGGTGLGLSIVKEIIETHHGTIIIDTSLGKGSIFIVQLVEHAPVEI